MKYYFIGQGKTNMIKTSDDLVHMYLLQDKGRWVEDSGLIRYFMGEGDIFPATEADAKAFIEAQANADKKRHT